MSLFDLKVGESAVICAVEIVGSAERRLHSLGIKKGEAVQALAFSIFRSSILVGVSQTRVALRRSVAQRIAVCKQ